MPPTVFFHDYKNEGWVTITVNDEIATDTKNNIQKYIWLCRNWEKSSRFCFAICDNTTDHTDDSVRNDVNESEINDLSRTRRPDSITKYSDNWISKNS